MNIKVDLWDKEVRELWSKNYVNELSVLLKKNGIKTILDVSGGTGYPSIELAQMEWDIEYSDSSIDMYNFFNKKVIENSLTIPSHLVSWQELDSKVSKKYDALLCRGNSFIYLDGYDEKDYSSKNIHLLMKKSLKQFFNRLNAQGIVYIDLIKEEKVENNTDTRDFFNYRILSEIEYIEELNLRKSIEKIIYNDGSIEQDIIYSYPIGKIELERMAIEAGFISVDEVNIDSSNFTDSFILRKREV